MVTRNDYVTGRASHSEYYGELADCIRPIVPINPDDIVLMLKAGDTHLNGVPMAEWDKWAAPYYRLALVRDYFYARNDSVTLQGMVCVLKERARQIARQRVSQRFAWWIGSKPKLARPEHFLASE